MLERMQRKCIFCTVLGNLHRHTMENGLEIPQEIKNGTPIESEEYIHFCRHSKEMKRGFYEISAFPCSWQLYYNGQDMKTVCVHQWKSVLRSGIAMLQGMYTFNFG